MSGSWDDPAVVYGRGSEVALLKGMGVAVGAAAITPSDADDLPYTCRSLYVGGAGDVRVRMINGELVTFAGVAASSLLPVAVVRVYATGTTATNIVGLK